MLRTIFNVATLASVILFLLSLACGSIGLWNFDDGFERFWCRGSNGLYFQSYQGIFVWAWSTGWPNSTSAATANFVEPLDKGITRNGMIFEITGERQTITDGLTTAVIRWHGIRSNLLLGTFFSSLLPVAWLLGWRRRRKKWMIGRRRRCGYDLRGLLTGSTLDS